MAKKRMLPVGMDIFEKLRSEEFYYVDKIGLVRNLLESRSEVTLFMRPRRFGKTLNMTMLQSFFEIGNDGSLFQGLAIAKERELWETYMGKFPVILSP
ncbi:MAG: AAA family ATPase [Roseburia sp.]|nr:AAA family ATPase [Roseburia sp.]